MGAKERGAISNIVSRTQAMTVWKTQTYLYNNDMEIILLCLSNIHHHFNTVKQAGQSSFTYYTGVPVQQQCKP
jgi:ABC-type xylose transport system substrate-binding protein